MILLHAVPSPFCRKIDIVVEHHGLSDKVYVQIAKTHDVNDRLEKENPLGKIPTLIMPNGDSLYDSEVIFNYLDDLGDEAKLMPQGNDKYLQLTHAKLATGITDAALLVVYEGRLRPADKYCQEIVDMQMAKVTKGLNWFVDNPPQLQKLNIVNISLAILLEYLDIRINEDAKHGTELGENKGQWRSSHPELEAWLAGFYGLYPKFADTRPY
ncbi:MAG: glutathione S-transferase N-terminal domain-containing protein [Rhizobiales bacterium]|nr:glutathione S-transferase N-terminal domain-containing protein [Hyphomicrobiales bacterium]